MAKNLLESPSKLQEGAPSKPYKGGPGCYDGVPGMVGRTHSPNAVPEKTYDEQPPLRKGKG